MAAGRLLVPVLLLFLLGSPSSATNSEGNALLALRRRVSDHYKVLQSWDATLVNPCTWFHVTCDSDNHVVRLDLGNAQIKGKLAPELGQLEHLQYLELYGNDISGPLPEEFGNLKNLISLDLYSNKLEGKIPRTFGRMRSLEFLRLNNNKLTGPIPRELTALSNLKILDLSNNDLCGTIPTGGSFVHFSPLSFVNNSRLKGPELQGLVSYDSGC
ncbi:unnamed protein product [Victoria cruziana]